MTCHQKQEITNRCSQNAKRHKEMAIDIFESADVQRRKIGHGENISYIK